MILKSVTVSINKKKMKSFLALIIGVTVAHGSYNEIPRMMKTF